MSKTSIQRRRAAGFTIIELMMVVLIIAILAGMVLAIAGIAGRKADVGKAIGDMEKIKNALEEYRLDKGAYAADPDYPNPVAWQANYDKLIKTGSLNLQKYGLVTNVYLDPWGRNYQYVRNPAEKFTYQLWSHGPSTNSPDDDVNVSKGQK
jgi:general secretion pathway protein G